MASFALCETGLLAEVTVLSVRESVDSLSLSRTGSTEGLGGYGCGGVEGWQQLPCVRDVLFCLFRDCTVR